MRGSKGKLPPVDRGYVEKKGRKITPKKAVELLKQHGTVVSEDEAELILDFMYKLGNMAVETYIKI